MAILQIEHGPDAGQRFQLTGDSVIVGRLTTNSVPLTDPRVSRKHFELRLTAPGRYRLLDLQSGNGTDINGQAVTSMDLRHQDEIRIGDTVLTFLEESQDREAPTERTRLFLSPLANDASEIRSYLSADLGSEILRFPERVNNDWLRTRLANLSILYEASDAVSEILDVEELLNRILDLVLQSTDADHGCALLVDSETGALMPQSIRSRRQESSAELVVSRTVVDHVLKNRQGVLVADAKADERFQGGESIAKHQLREILCVPMSGRREVVGVLFLDTSTATASNEHKFTQDHLRLAIAVAHQAALAIEETRYYQAMIQSERLAAVGQTIAALSHHIKNIMQGVRFGSDMVRIAMTSSDTEMLQKGWRLVEKNQAKIDDLILDMLNYSKEREPVISTIDLNGLILEVIDVIRGRASQQQIALEFTPKTDLPAIPCDADGIHRALLNVLSNAVDAVEDHESPRVEIQVNWRRHAEEIEILVRDNGPGIPAEKLEEIFKPFVSTKGSRGTGLGLPASLKTLREHGGDIVAESSPGHGSAFHLHWPLAKIELTPETQ